MFGFIIFCVLGVPIWAITPQNEPEFPAPWEACAFDPEYEMDFINQYLGPTLKQNHPDVLILAFDHNKDHLLTWAEVVMGGDTGPNGGYVDGMAFHWYTGEIEIECYMTHIETHMPARRFTNTNAHQLRYANTITHTHSINHTHSRTRTHTHIHANTHTRSHTHLS